MVATLQISIPTYNRPDKFKILMMEFEGISDLCNLNKIVVVVFDNSDSVISEINRRHVPSFVKYVWNETNIGFGGNVKKCLHASLGLFTWIISDDDSINTSKIRSLLNLLEKIDPLIKGVALPCEIKSFVTEDSSLEIGLIPEFGKIINFKNSILPSKLPFDYLAGFIIKTEVISKNELLNINVKNDYIHSLIYCSCLQPSDLIVIYHEAIITYESSEKLNWTLSSLIRSKLEICQVLDKHIGVSMSNSALVTEVLKWAIFSRMGMCHLENLENDRIKLLTVAIKNISLRNFLLGLLLLLPKLLSTNITIFALALFGKANSDLGAIKKIRKNTHLIKSRLKGERGGKV